MPSERHAALSIKQRHEKPIATVLTTQHSKSQVVPSLCIPNPESPRRPAGIEHLQKSQAHDPMSRIPEGQLLCRRSSISTPIMRKNIFGDQPERESASCGIPGMLRKCLPDRIITASLRDFSPFLRIERLEFGLDVFSGTRRVLERFCGRHR